MRRLRRRYLALKAEGRQFLDSDDLIHTIWSAVYQLFGEQGASQTGLVPVDSNGNSGIYIIRCYHKALNLIRAAVASITEINGERAVVRVVGVSGTIKGLRRKVATQET